MRLDEEVLTVGYGIMVAAVGREAALTQARLVAFEGAAQ
jgi:hypothetical protein